MTSLGKAFVARTVNHQTIEYVLLRLGTAEALSSDSRQDEGWEVRNQLGPLSVNMEL